MADAATTPPGAPTPVKVALLYFEGCPHWRTLDAHLQTLAAEFPQLRVVHCPVETPEDARRLGFRGSPSILVEGVDPFADDGAAVGLSCRVYRTPDGPAGAPTLEQLREALRDR